MVKLFIILCAIIPLIYSQCTVERAKPDLQRSIYEFSLSLLTRIAQENENHFVTSPLSIWTLLASASLGATDKTLKELKQILDLNNNKCFNQKYLQIARQATTIDDTDVSLERSSAIFVNDQTPLKRKYQNKIERARISEVVPIPFDNTEAVAASINDYVNTATHGNIDEIVSANDLEDTILVMVDAIFFKGSWAKAFDPANTETSAFYNDKGVQVGDVELMYISGTFKVDILQNIEAKVLELPYGQNERASMLIFLPYKNVPLSKVIDNLKSISLSSVHNSFKEIGPQTVSVQIPKFKITSDLNNLKELLVDMGLKTAFDGRAQFTELSDMPLFITNIVQKADIEVSEEGTVASAASAVEFGWRSSPEEFVCNRPFMFMIVDNANSIPIFTGAFSKPTPL